MARQDGALKSRRPPSFGPYLAGGAILFAVSLWGFVQIQRRPGLPKSLVSESVVRIDDISLRTGQDQNFALAWKSIGEPADFTVRAEDGTLREVTLSVAAYYEGTSYLWVYLVIGLVSAALGSATFILKPADPKAKIFYALSLTFAAALLIGGEDYGLRPARLWTFVPGGVYFFGYALVPALLLDFALAFSRRPVRLRRLGIYLPGLAIAAVQTASFLVAYLGRSADAYRFLFRFTAGFRIYLLGFVLAAFVRLGLALGRAADEETKSQIQWIVYGFAVGAAPFLFLYQIPRLLGLVPVLSENFSEQFFLIIPVCLAIAIVRHRLMDISLVINRSLVYSVLTVFTVGLYLLIVQVVGRLFVRWVPVRAWVFSALGVFLAAAAFQPAQRRIQDWIDLSFFRKRYDYRRLVMDFGERAGGRLTQDELIADFCAELRKALLVEDASVIPGPRFAAGGGPGGLSASSGGTAGFDPGADLGPVSGTKTWARPAAVEALDLADTGREAVLERFGWDVVVALPGPGGEAYGWTALGRRKSGARFGREDLELVRTMACELAANLERLRLQEEIITERALQKKLDELNRLKTEFISTVSHELRTPMSSIQGLAELLQSGKIKSREQREQFLSVMVAESGRLSRFLHNVLDFGRIERQDKTYRFEPADLRVILEDALGVFRVPLEERGFRVDVRFPDHPVERKVDADSLKQALINIIDNALKYSAEEKRLEIELVDAGAVEITVRDRGIGIAAEDQAKIFEKFYRTTAAGRLSPRGAGLGLKIVKHIVDAHGGEIRVESEVNKGTTFRLILPEGRGD